MPTTRISLNFESFPRPTFKKVISIRLRLVAVGIGLFILGMLILFVTLVVFTFEPDNDLNIMLSSAFIGALVSAGFTALWTTTNFIHEIIGRGPLHSKYLTEYANKAQNIHTFTRNDSLELLRWHHSAERHLTNTLTLIGKMDYESLPDTIAFGTTYKELDKHTIKFDLFWSQKSGFYLLAEDLEFKPKKSIFSK